MSTEWIGRITDVVKSAANTRSGWPRILEVCRETKPAELWSALPNVESKRDVESASAWLRSQLKSNDAPHPARGLYLGLNTLNMDGPDGHNLELGATSQCNPSRLDTDWPWQCEWYGGPHLIESLCHLKRVYDSPRFESLAGFADYALFLGYSGLVLAEAMESLKVSSPLLAAWGFCDGDLFFLGRREAERFERICHVF